MTELVDDFKLEVVGGARVWDPIDDNVDVVVTLSDGKRYFGTFFTLENVARLFAKNRETGECASGLYLWASGMILVRTLTDDVMRQAVRDLIQSGELESAFTSQ